MHCNGNVKKNVKLVLLDFTPYAEIYIHMLPFMEESRVVLLCVGCGWG